MFVKLYFSCNLGMFFYSFSKGDSQLSFKKINIIMTADLNVDLSKNKCSYSNLNFAEKLKFLPTKT